MITNKKGLSDVVTTVLIILLVVAAIAVLWSFVGPTINKAGNQVNQQTFCLVNSVDIQSCTHKGSDAFVSLVLKTRYDQSVSGVDSVAYTITSHGSSSGGTTTANTVGTNLNPTKIGAVSKNGALTTVKLATDSAVPTGQELVLATADTAEITPVFKLKNGETTSCPAVQTDCINS